MLQTLVLTLLLAGGALSTAPPVSASGQQLLNPTLSLKFNSASQYSQATESTSAMIIVTGNISIEAIPVERCVVTLSSSTDIGWISQVSPTVVVFTSTTPQSFTCNVIVPAGTPFSQYGNLIIRGHAVACGYQDTAEIKCIVATGPYFMPGLMSTNPLVEIMPGESASFECWVRNDGNAVDSFEMGISNLDELTTRRWTIAGGGGTVNKVQPGESKSGRFTVASPKDELVTGDYFMNIVVKATSQNAKDFQQVVWQDLTLTVHVRTHWLPQLSPYLVIIALSVVVACLAARLVRERKRRW